MKFVQPIRNKEKISEMEAVLKDKELKYWVMFNIGIFAGLRISDILPLKVKHVRGMNHITLIEEKTEKEKRFEVNPVLKKVLREYCAGKDDEEYLIRSRQGGNKPITRDMAYKVLRQAAKQVGLDGIGTHSMRKTLGFHLFKKCRDIEIIRKMYSHSSGAVTRRYIGIEQDTIDEAIRGIRY